MEIDGKEAFQCFVYREEVQVIDGVRMEPCSMEECNLNQDSHPYYKLKNERAGLEVQ